MRKTLLILALSVASGAAQAQIKCWNEGGKRVCGDTPPPGAKVTTMRGAASGPAAPAPAPAAKDAAKDGAKAAKKGPLTPAEQEQEYRKRQDESAKASAKAAEEQRNAEAKRANCAQARQALVELESGLRISRINPATGERYFLEESQIAQEAGKAREAIRSACN
jgi:hypothetical protein